jgi:hypothetical protein
MSTTTTEYESELQALGRMLDRRGSMPRAVCLLQTDDGYIVHMLETASTHESYAAVPVSVVIKRAELRAAMNEPVVTTDHAPAKTGGLGWLKRR